MISYRIGNLVQADEGIILHGCNAQGKMGSGVAKAIRARFPLAYKEYHQGFKDGWLDLGTVFWVTDDDRLIGNCITQKFYGYDGKKYVSYDAIHECMVEVKVMIDHKLKFNLPYNGVAMPRMGSTLGGGNWKVIEAIINDVLRDQDVTVYDLESQ